MNTNPFGLSRPPFGPQPAPLKYYPADSQTTCLQRLHEAVQDGEPFAMLTGEPGVGKTLVARHLIEKIGDRREIVWITNTRLANAAALFQAFLFDLGEDYQSGTEQELRLRFVDGVLRQFADGQPTLLVVDESQNLTPGLLEELRLLSNLESDGGPSIQTILIGQPALLEKLGRGEAGGLAQRIGQRISIRPLEAEEVGEYVAHHLREAGGRPERIIGEEALDALTNAVHGIPRLINQAMRRALQLAAQGEQDCVELEVMLEALDELGLTSGPLEHTSEGADSSMGRVFALQRRTG